MDKNNKILIGLGIAAVIGVGGYFIYTKVIKKTAKSEIKTDTTATTETKTGWDIKGIGTGLTTKPTVEGIYTTIPRGYDKTKYTVVKVDEGWKLVPIEKGSTITGGGAAIPSMQFIGIDDKNDFFKQ